MKNLPYSCFFILLLIFSGFSSCINPNTDATPTNPLQNIISPDTKLTFTKHAKCRMACRGIDEAEIREVLREGRINYKKTDEKDKPCPSYAIEDVVKSGQRLRIVFGKCDDVVKVITCIDLDSEVECECN